MVEELSIKLCDLANTVATFADHFTTKGLTFTRATGEDLTLTHELYIADGANDNAPLCLTKTQLAAVLSAIGSTNTPISVPSSASNIRELRALPRQKSRRMLHFPHDPQQANGSPSGQHATLPRHRRAG
jgi:hypothetical protein